MNGGRGIGWAIQSSSLRAEERMPKEREAKAIRDTYEIRTRAGKPIHSMLP